MSVHEGVYKSLLQGVSQQTPQERTDGQLAEQINMVSDPVTGLRRRSGVKHLHTLWWESPEAYMDIVEINGSPRLVHIDTSTGKLSVYPDITQATVTSSTPHTQVVQEFKTVNGKASLKAITIGQEYYVVNTEKIPTVVQTGQNAVKDPRKWGYFSIRSSQFGQKFDVTISLGSYTQQVSYTASTSEAAMATPEYVAEVLVSRITSDSEANAKFTTQRLGSTISIEVKDKTGIDVLDVSSTNTGGSVYVSGVSRVNSKTELLGTLPPALDGYIMAVGALKNSAYFKYSSESKLWSESGAYTPTYYIANAPIIIDLQDKANITAASMQIEPRSAGDEDNNPLPSFIDYGITGISAYQSRLILLSGSYVCMSKTNTFTEFMRTTVTELLDDDAIEISSAALSAAQFEYAVPFNKDLVLVAQGQQAVIPANSTVLTPKTAVIYPSTTVEVSLAVKPVTASRTMYYVYQQGVQYYQVGEYIPNTYTEAQLYSQNLTDHIPLYAEGVCTSVASSVNNGMIVFSSDSTDVLVHQYIWVGEERPLMAFHKWRFKDKVVKVQFLKEYLVLFFKDASGSLRIGTLNTQMNQLDTKPIPYLDMYMYVDVPESGVADVQPIFNFVDWESTVATVYNSSTMRHAQVQYTLDSLTIKCPYVGRIAIGTPYESTFTLTPPFIRDNNGKVVTGSRTTLQSLKMTYKNTGTFNVEVADTMGQAYTGERTTYTWSEADLGYTWVGSVGSVNIPCRTRLSSTECTVSTAGTTDMNLITTEYVVRTAQKRRRM